MLFEGTFTVPLVMLQRGTAFVEPVLFCGPAFVTGLGSVFEVLFENNLTD
jgi:hypothetical protein